jgi:ADP-ribose pyrophosphatase YjhB (NUDIX family)
MSTIWRPRPAIRPVVIALIRRGEELLAAEVRDDAGALMGWRPLGGAIEFGERAAEALRRELLEEIGQTIADPALLTVLENHYEHHGARGHEIVFVFQAAFNDPSAYRRDSFEFDDAGAHNSARWVDLARFRDRRDQLFPAGLLDVL